MQTEVKMDTRVMKIPAQILSRIAECKFNFRMKEQCRDRVCVGALTEAGDVEGTGVVAVKHKQITYFDAFERYSVGRASAV